MPTLFNFSAFHSQYSELAIFILAFVSWKTMDELLVSSYVMEISIVVFWLLRTILMVYHPFKK